LIVNHEFSLEFKSTGTQPLSVFGVLEGSPDSLIKSESKIAPRKES